MTTPSEKSPELTEFLEKAFGRTSAIESDSCAFCHGPAIEFKDDLSRKEFTISGLCQNCQDNVFDEDPYGD